jgi:signal transduction histidine kinase
MLKTVIRNLCSNAIKFTQEKGCILITCKNEDDLVKIYVKDDGMGLSEDRKNKLFDGTGYTTLGTNGEKGTGFGLPMCKEMIEKMNGTIEVESEGLGKGTTFIITLKSE